MPDPIPPAAPDESTPPPGDAPPEMTPTLLARLFVVPLLIVVMMLACTGVVLLLFGWISATPQESIAKLLDRIDAGSGEKVVGLLMLPQDREVWQAAMELARRLESDDPRDLPEENRPEIARRLGVILERTRGIEQAPMGQEMQQYLLKAVGRLGQSDSVELLIKFATDEKQPVNVRRDAIGGLVLMRRVPAARRSCSALIPLLESPESVLRIAATVAIGALADAADQAAIQALTRAYQTNDREMAWNATLALARLGVPVAVPGLLDMLKRSYWEDVKVNAPGQPSTGLPAGRKDDYLKTSIDAAAAMGDASLKAAVEKLTADPSLQVRDHAVRALRTWESATRTGS